MLKKILLKFYIVIIKIFRNILKIIFQFDHWHILPLEARLYAKDIIKCLNNEKDLQKNKIVEIGCGLGDILRSVNYLQKYGLDSDENVLRALKFISKLTFRNNINTSKFVFPTDKLDDIYDTIIMVNWIHHIPPETLRKYVKLYFENHLNKKGIFVLDTVKSSKYEYNHSIEELTNSLNVKIKRIGTYEAQREIFFLIK